MYSARQVLNEKYALLCQQKGDLMTQRQKLDERLVQIDKEIDALNTAFTHLPELQSRIIKEIKQAQNEPESDSESESDE